MSLSDLLLATLYLAALIIGVYLSVELGQWVQPR